MEKIEIITQKKIISDVLIIDNFIDNLNKVELIPKQSIDSIHVLIIDKILVDLYGLNFINNLTILGYKIKMIEVDSGESLKTIENYSSLSQNILRSGIDSNSIIISFGGGTINNLTGFIASTLYRGLGLVHIPTTLMAQCDAAIGIKQGINTENGKNLIGSYYEPLKIIVDPTFLLSNTTSQLQDGLVECIKHALAQDEEFFNYLLDYDGELKNLQFLKFIISKNISLKIDLMNIDPLEKNKGLVLQYGHTIGHVVEYLSGYSIGHGLSVSIGLRVAAEISVLSNYAEQSLVEKHIMILKKFNLPYSIPDNINIEDIIENLKHCKRYSHGKFNFVILKKIGELFSINEDHSYECGADILKESLIKSY